MVFDVQVCKFLVVHVYSDSESLKNGQDWFYLEKIT